MARTALSRRARAIWIAAGSLALTLAVVAALVLQPWLLFIDVRVDDAIPRSVPTSASASPSPAQSTPAAEPAAEPAVGSPEQTVPAGPVDLLAGAFVSHEHPTAGTARVIAYPDGTRQLAIEGLETSNGPDVHVWLSAGPVIEGFDGWFTAAGYDHIDLGPLRGNLGDQLYDIPAEADLATFRTVDLWCEQFSVSFGAAGLS